MSEGRADHGEPSARLGAGDGAAAAALVLTAAACALFWWRGIVPFPFLGSDLGNIASFAAARMRPEAFAGDALLADPAHYGYYVTVLIPVLTALSRVFGNLGTAGVSLLFPVVLIQALGFYTLGRILFGARLPAFLLALLSLGKVDLTVDYWGVYHDAQPRMLFQALFPFLLALTLRYGERPKVWPLILAACGLLIYVHPVSTPSVAFATWLGLFAVRPPGWTRTRQVVVLGACGVVFLAVTAPFLALYLSQRAYGTAPDYQQMIGFYRDIVGSHFTDAATYVRFSLTNWKAHYLLPAWGLMGFCAVVAWQRTARWRYVFFVFWTAGLLLTSVGITFVEQAVGRRFHVLPVEIDLIRNIRYVSPVLLVFAVWGTYLSVRRLPRRPGAIVLVLVAIGWLSINRPGSIPFRDTLGCLHDGRLLCPPEYVDEQVAALTFLRDRAPPGVPVLPVLGVANAMDFALAVRYFAFKPVAFAEKDGGTFTYANHAAVAAWMGLHDEIAGISRLTDPAEKLARITALADRIGAGVIVVDFPVATDEPKEGFRVLLRSGSLAVVGKTDRAP